MLIVQTLICGITYALTWQTLFYRTCLLPYSAYARGSILLGIAGHKPTLAFLLIGVLPLFVFRNRITWEEIDDSFKARNLVWIVSLVMGVTFILSDYNYYYDHAFLLDRVVLVALLVLVRFHPGFLFPFVVLLMAFALQLHHPLPDGMWNWPDKRMPTHILFIWVWFVYLRIVVRTDARLPLILAMLVAGSTYAHAGLSKLAIGPELTTWLLENPTSNIFVSAYQQGNWLGQLSRGSVTGAAHFLRSVDVLTNGLTLFAELGAALILLDRRLARFFLSACIAMHLGILASTGIFFWKWIIVDIAMIWYAGSLWRWGLPEMSTSKLTAAALPTMTFLFALTRFATTGILFAWWDTGHVQFFTYEVETESGETYRLDPRYFVPYDIVFVQSRFYYTVPHKLLPGTYGVSHRYPVFAELREATVDDLPSIDERYALMFFNPQLRYAFRRFIQRYVGAAMDGDQKNFLPTWFSVPYHFQTTFPPDTYRGQSPIRTVHMYFEEHFFDGTKIHDLQRTEIMAIPIENEITPSVLGQPSDAPTGVSPPTPVQASDNDTADGGPPEPQ